MNLIYQLIDLSTGSTVDFHTLTAARKAAKHLTSFVIWRITNGHAISIRLIDDRADRKFYKNWR